MSTSPAQSQLGYSPRAVRAVAASFGGVALGLAWLVGSLTYYTVAALEGISDQRSHDVTLLFGCWLSALWLTGTIANAIRKHVPVRAKSLRHAVMNSASRRFVGAVAGLCIATFATSLVLIGISSVPVLVVTPPAAWLIMTPATGIGGLIGVRTLGDAPGSPWCNPSRRLAWPFRRGPCRRNL